MNKEVIDSQESIFVKDSTKGSVTSSGKARSIKIEDVLKKAKSLFEKSMWIDNSSKMKRKSIEKALQDVSNSYSKDTFIIEFANRVNSLLDSAYFIKKCKEKNCDPYAAATHIVMMKGKKGINLLLLDRKYDANDSIFKQYPEWKDPIFTKSELGQYLDSYDSDEESVETAE